MNAMNDVKPQLVTVVLSAGLLAGAGAHAQSYPKEGPFEYVSCFAGTTNSLPFSKTHSGGTSEYTGTIRSERPDSPFDKLSFRCLAFNASFDGKAVGSTVCETTDKDGDKYLTYFNLGADGKSSRETVAGTGKFDGFTARGVSTPLGPFPSVQPGTIQNCSRQTGTYKFK